MSTPHELDVLQRWMQAVITHPSGIRAGLEAPAARGEMAIAAADVERIIVRSRALTSLERIEVYANAYYSRLLSCLREFFPALLQALGEELFDQFAIGYLQEHPPSSYTLSRLADRFIDYLEQSRPPREADENAAGNADWADFFIDLARLEWAIDGVFDGEGIEDASPLSPTDVAAVDPAAWPNARLRVAPCLRLLAFRFPVNDYYSEFRRGNEPPLPGPADDFLALTRREYVVRRIPLSAAQFALLEGLARGETVGEAIASVAAHHGVDRLAGELHGWFREWAAAGLFLRVDAPPPVVLACPQLEDNPREESSDGA